MDKLYIICPNSSPSSMLNSMINSTVKGSSYEIIKEFRLLQSYENKKIVFALELDSLGYDCEMILFLKKLDEHNISFKGSVCSLLIHSKSEFYTKRAAQDITFLINNMGGAFIGHPLIEATSTLNNFLTWQKVYPDQSLKEICLSICEKQGLRLSKYKTKEKNKSKILLLYSSPNIKSNTVALWNMVKDNLIEMGENVDITEVQIESGEVLDCKGCLFQLCVHYGERNSCFYGGQMVKEVLPAIEENDVIVWLAPNYNDTLAANLTAVINRLTVLYRKIKFYNKKIFGIVVSGNSGSDSVAKQLIGALNINKGFFLPPNFAICETANDPNAIYGVENIEEKACSFAKHMLDNI
ncbi:flavodoxin family protein [Oceanirhabdus sp. W0125-5]|uniref:flavodoxin family protein n=1 Tax=Oceanirhabdus sp. W0125-5 TaxID=2999116 RepID=UPI0022F30227|nr:NAD(P)H-dependent oxidoreductase [Oceanirhabdus sp. W0125-5]WBW95986.1 NAD(P)H-dependent oxidoreductase [Oceanirhabdus sp. W0125-5]